jgi:hypothetical protein
MTWVRFPSAEDADVLQPRTELTALVVAAGDAAETVLVDGVLDAAAAFAPVELFDELETAVCRLGAAGVVCPRPFPSRLSGDDLPAESCFGPVSEQLVGVAGLPLPDVTALALPGVPALALPGAGSWVVGEAFCGGHVGVAVLGGGAEA